MSEDPVRSRSVSDTIEHGLGSLKPTSPTDTTAKPTLASAVDSETTLTDHQDAAAVTSQPEEEVQKAISTSIPSRPDLASRKMETEAILPVAARPALPEVQRRSTGGRQALSAVRRAPFAYDSSDDSSSEEGEPITEHESRRESSSNALSTKHLNQVQEYPRHSAAASNNLDGAHSKFKIQNENFSTSGKVNRDGRLNISVNEATQNGYLAKALGSTITRHFHPNAQDETDAADREKVASLQAKGDLHVPKLNIVIMVIGSRGDIQPFVKVGQILKEKYGHRVRLATHPTFKKFIEEDAGLEFFSVGGDPSELMSFMVKNPGLIPSFETIKAGEIGRRREQMFEMFQGFWRACVNTTDDETDIPNLKMLGSKYPFVADAIIANPPSMAGFHCAAKLGIPLHLMFTFPYSPTQSFPHPLANIKTSNVDQSYTNYMSYPLVDLMTWQGLGDLINRFRVQTLGLEPVSTLWAPGQFTRLKVPMTYMWSPGLVPKPPDWGPEIDVTGYVFLDLASKYEPPKDLSDFLDRSKDDRPLVYIGFGSISGVDGHAFTKLIFESVKKAGVRAVVSKGWGGMGEGMDKPDGVFMIDNVPHDWLFTRVDAVIHHGGAGTTSAGLKLGKPTMIVPFFGDQPFWAAMVSSAGAGAKEALPLKKLNSDLFAKGIKECLEHEAKEKAGQIARSIAEEGDGAENAVDSFHRQLPLHGKKTMLCGIFPDRPAVWEVKHTDMRLSALAADILIQNKQVRWHDLELIRNFEYRDFAGPGEPITGAGGALLSSFQEAMHGFSSIGETTKRDMKKYERRKRRKQGNSVEDAVVMPGKMAHAARGPHTDGEKENKRQEDRDLENAVNMHGEAEPLKAPPSISLAKSHSEPPQDAPSQPESQSQAQAPPLARTTTTTSSIGNPAVFITKDVSKGLGHSTKAIVRIPFDMYYATVQGFRNAPRLYGDRTVRKPPDVISGMRSGLKTAGSEFVFGIYDGVTGLVRIPHHDVKADGMAGFPKGVARGVGGLVLKPVAGSLGLTAYSVKGAYMSVRKRVRDTEKTERWIRRARMSQGAKELYEIKMEGAELYDKKKQRGYVMPTRKKQAEALEKVRSEALVRWGSRGKDALEESREKQNNPVETAVRARVASVAARASVGGKQDGEDKGPKKSKTWT